MNVNIQPGEKSQKSTVRPFSMQLKKSNFIKLHVFGFTRHYIDVCARAGASAHTCLRKKGQESILISEFITTSSQNIFFKPKDTFIIAETWVIK